MKSLVCAILAGLTFSAGICLAEGYARGSEQAADRDKIQ